MPRGGGCLPRGVYLEVSAQGACLPGGVGVFASGACLPGGVGVFASGACLPGGGACLHPTGMPSCLNCSVHEGNINNPIHGHVLIDRFSR